MSALTGRQRKYLRGLAHDLDPVVHVGQQGLTEAVLREAEKGLAVHELIKVRLAGERREREEAAGRIAAELGAERVGLVGRVGIFYRRHPEPEKARIRLPGGAG